MVTSVIADLETGIIKIFGMETSKKRPSKTLLRRGGNPASIVEVEAC